VFAKYTVQALPLIFLQKTLKIVH